MNAQDRSGWFVLQVKPRHEKTVASTLRGKGFEEFLPLYKTRNKWADRYKDVVLPLFPGYVFCRFDPANMLPILVTPGVFQVVSFGKVPAAVDELEVERLETLVQTSLSYEPWPYLKVGQSVIVSDGPLKGTEGVLVQVRNTYRLVISVTLLQRSVAIEVDRDWVQPADGSQNLPGSIMATLAARER